MQNYLNSREFYELLYYYRHTPLINNELVVKRFEAIKTKVLQKHKESNKELLEIAKESRKQILALGTSLNDEIVQNIDELINKLQS